MDEQQVIRAVANWVDTVVVQLNLCPFAGKELDKQRVRFVVTEATDEEGVLQDLAQELEFLNQHPDTETTLLICTGALSDFTAYNQFLDYTDGLLQQLELTGTYQIASFHPDYQFAGTDPDDVENYSNRSPYPILHLLREASLEAAIAAYPAVGEIPGRNIALLRSLGLAHMQALLEASLGNSRDPARRP